MSFDLKITNGDLVIQNGDLSTIKGTDKLIQDILKIALTTAGANVLQPWYGSLVSKTLIGSALRTDIISSYAKSQLQTAIETLKKLQNIQVSSGQKMTPDEQIAFIKDISIQRDSSDPRNFRVSIQVLNRVFGKVAAYFSVTNT
jgi:phage baseplate assembly protein W